MSFQTVVAAKCDRCGEVIQVSHKGINKNLLQFGFEELKVEMQVLGWVSYSNWAGQWVHCPNCKDSTRSQQKLIKEEVKEYARSK